MAVWADPALAGSARRLMREWDQLDALEEGAADDESDEYADWLANGDG